MAQQGDNEDRNLIKVVARVDQLETVITGNKDMVSKGSIISYWLHVVGDAQEDLLALWQ